MSSEEQLKIEINSLRNKHRNLRRELSDDVLQEHAIKLENKLVELPEYQSADHIAAYIAILGEISVEPVIRSGAIAGKQFYLPVLRGDAMAFAPWHPDAPLQKKKFGLLEPDCSESDWIDPSSLDLVLSPLVVFDAFCNRIGQGGGYYDRTFEFTRRSANPVARPILIGVAHDCQKEPSLTPQPWDIPLHKVVTESAVYAAR